MAVSTCWTWAERAGRSNLEYVKLDWTAADPVSSEWEGRFDMVFASMCPAVKSREGLDKMSFVSGGHCVINQMIESKDTVAEMLREELAIRPSYDPHNDRDFVQGIFNILWLQGYEPEIAYLKERMEVRLSVEEAASRYAGKFGETAAERGLSLREILSGGGRGRRDGCEKLHDTCDDFLESPGGRVSMVGGER